MLNDERKCYISVKEHCDILTNLLTIANSPAKWLPRRQQPIFLLQVVGIRGNNPDLTLK